MAANRGVAVAIGLGALAGGIYLLVRRISRASGGAEVPPHVSQEQARESIRLWSALNISAFAIVTFRQSSFVRGYWWTEVEIDTQPGELGFSQLYTFQQAPDGGIVQLYPGLNISQAVTRADLKGKGA